MKQMNAFYLSARMQHTTAPAQHQYLYEKDGTEKYLETNESERYCVIILPRSNQSITINTTSTITEAKQKGKGKGNRIVTLLLYGEWSSKASGQSRSTRHLIIIKRLLLCGKGEQEREWKHGGDNDTHDREFRLQRLTEKDGSLVTRYSNFCTV